MIEHKVGEIFPFERRVLKVVEQDGCDGCYFNSFNGESCERPKDGVFEYCFKSYRNDKKNVVFMTLEKNDQMMVYFGLTKGGAHD